MKDARQKSKFYYGKVAEREEKIEDLELKVELFANFSHKVVRLQGEVTTLNTEFISMRKAPWWLIKALATMNLGHALLQSELHHFMPLEDIVKVCSGTL